MTEAALKKSIRDEMILNVQGLFRDYERPEEDLAAFLIKTDRLIDLAVDTMIESYRIDGELQDLQNREADWVREFLEHVFERIDFL